jgi:hypothetical protein
MSYGRAEELRIARVCVAGIGHEGGALNVHCGLEWAGCDQKTERRSQGPTGEVSRRRLHFRNGGANLPVRSASSLPVVPADAVEALRRACNMYLAVGV